MPNHVEYGWHIAEWLYLSRRGLKAFVSRTLVSKRIHSGIISLHHDLTVLCPRFMQQHRDMMSLSELEQESAQLLKSIDSEYEKGLHNRPLFRSWFSARDLTAARDHLVTPIELSFCWFKFVYLCLFAADAPKRKGSDTRLAILNLCLERLRTHFPKTQCTHCLVPNHSVDMKDFNHIQLLALSYIVQLTSGWILADIAGDNWGRAYFSVQLKYATPRVAQALFVGGDYLQISAPPPYSIEQGQGDPPEYSMATSENGSIRQDN